MTSPAPRPPRPRSRLRRWLLPLFLVLLAAGGGYGYLVYGPKLFPQKRPDLILHRVKLEGLPVSVVEKGTLESADNRDIICKVKAGSRGTYASTIKWVIDDGSLVTKGQPIVELDDSALQDQRSTQRIAVEKAQGEYVKADGEYNIQLKQNEADIATADAALEVAELELDKLIGYRFEPGLNPFGAIAGVPATLSERGFYRSQLDDVSAQLKQAESDLDAYRERAAWANRSVKLGYLTATQAKAEVMKLASAQDKVDKLSKDKFILETFTRQRDLTDLRSKTEVARIGLDKALRQAKAKEQQTDSLRKTALSIYQQELDKLKEIEEQISHCRILAPQDGMVVYYVPENSRFSSNQEGLIQQGAQVKENQKLIRIPDLRRMQVNTRVHEALVSRIKGDDRRSTGMSELIRTGLLLNPDGFSRLIGQSEYALTAVRDHVRDKEYYIASRGMPATVRVDAITDRVFTGRVRSVAAVASQNDWMSSADVKVYQTFVLLEETVDGLKPGMNAEVTIHVDDSTEPVLAVPIGAVLGGAEAGPKRSVYVLENGQPVEREVELGKFNDKMIEVRRGLQEGDQVVVNPKVVVGDKMKTREEMESRTRTGPPGGTNGGEKKGKKGGDPTKAGGGKGGPTGGPPAQVGGGGGKVGGTAG